MSTLIAIDAGHGYNTPGKRCLGSIDSAQTREWSLNNRIADMVKTNLEKYYKCKCLLVGDATGKKDISLSARVKTANSAKADVYISIHHNAGINGGSGGGTVVYYCSNKCQRAVQAKNLYNSIVDRTGLKGNRSQNTINKAFTVLKGTEMPAFLIENGFMDSLADTLIILTEEHARQSAQGIIDWVVKEYAIKERGAVEKPITKPEVNYIYYPAYIGKKTYLSAALTTLGINSTFAYRAKIAKANNITGYIGTATQNTRIYNLLCAGKLKKLNY